MPAKVVAKVDRAGEAPASWSASGTAKAEYASRSTSTPWRSRLGSSQFTILRALLSRAPEQVVLRLPCAPQHRSPLRGGGAERLTFPVRLARFHTRWSLVRSDPAIVLVESLGAFAGAGRSGERTVLRPATETQRRCAREDGSPACTRPVSVIVLACL